MLGGSCVNLEVVVGELRDRQHVIERDTADGEQCNCLVWGEGTEGLRGEEPLPLLRGGMSLRDRGRLWEEDRRLVGAAAV